MSDEARDDSRKDVVGSDRSQTNFPVRTFLYTLDQVAYILDVSQEKLNASYIYYVGRSGGPGKRHFIAARNIGEPGATPEWRVAENELMRWMRLKGFRYKNGTKLVD